jgi:two-component system, OmpR family, response regulator
MQSTQNLKVLLVEDSPVLKERMSALISSLEHVRLVGVADTEASAIEAATRECVDVIILDLHLKQGSGFGVMKALAESGLKPQFVILTNYDLPEYQKIAVTLGAAHFLDKARDFGEVPALLEGYLHKTDQHALAAI